jgi:hypothetical protein
LQIVLSCFPKLKYFPKPNRREGDETREINDQTIDEENDYENSGDDEDVDGENDDTFYPEGDTSLFQSPNQSGYVPASQDLKYEKIN